MKKYIRSLVLILFFSLILLGCDEPEPPQPPADDTHDCFEHQSDWFDAEEFTCGEIGIQNTKCTKCGDIVDERTITKKHEYQEEVVKEVTCTENGTRKRYCIFR